MGQLVTVPGYTWTSSDVGMSCGNVKHPFHRDTGVKRYGLREMEEDCNAHVGKQKDRILVIHLTQATEVN